MVGYALIYQVTRILFAADRASSAARVTVLGWLTVVGASAAAVRLMAPDGGDGRATLIALAIGLTAGMGVAGVGMLLALARTVGGGALRPTLRVLAVGAPTALATGAEHDHQLGPGLDRPGRCGRRSLRVPDPGCLRGGRPRAPGRPAVRHRWCTDS